MDSTQLQQLLMQGLQHHQAGRFHDAELCYRQVLSHNPQDANAYHLLGVMAHQLGKPDIAVPYLQQATALRPNVAEFHANLALAFQAQGNLEMALRAAENAVRQKPDLATAHNTLGTLLGKLGQADRAAAAFQEALRLSPAYAEAYNNLGNLHQAQGRLDDAVEAYQAALRLNARYAAALSNLGNTLRQQGKHAQAVDAFRAALEHDPRLTGAIINLGATLREMGDIPGAVAAFSHALSLQPGSYEAAFNLGTMHLAQGSAQAAAERLQTALDHAPPPARADTLLALGDAHLALRRWNEAAACYRRVLETRPGDGRALHNAGIALAEIGQVAEAVDFLARAVELDPANPAPHSTLLYLMEFDPRSTDESLRAQAHRWHERHAAALTAAAAPLAPDPAPGRPLRIGLLSPDFRGHAQIRFVVPLLEHLDKSRFAAHCYSTVRRPDAMTAQVQRLAGAWHEVRDLSDEQLAARIRADGIDVLVDLTMHMEDHRLGVLARRPAPVQVSWLAYPGVTGLGAIDYHLTDRRLHPAESGNLAGGERPLYLPACWFCYQRDPAMPAVSLLPALSRGEITFGSLNTMRKVSPVVLELWARLLEAVQAAGRKSRLLLITPTGDHRQGILQVFAARGIAGERIDLRSPAPYAQYIANCLEIDIALDPFPHAGATTTLDALCMGVPVLSLRGTTPVGRLGETILAAAGLSDWLAQSPEEYLAKAVAFARDLPHLAGVRGRLRQQVEASPLMDAPRFARAFGDAMQHAWREAMTRP